MQHSIYFAKSTKKIDTYVGFMKLGNDTRNKVVIMTTRTDLRDGFYDVTVKPMRKDNGYIVETASFKKPLRLSETLTPQTGTQIMACAEKEWFYGQWHSPISKKVVKFDALDAHEVIGENTKYYTTFDKNGTLLVYLDTKLTHHSNLFVGTMDISIALCDPI